MNRSGRIGTETETAVVRVLQSHGWPHAERRRLRGQHDAGDIAGTPGVAWSVKGGDAARYASDGQVAAWLQEAERMRLNTGDDLAVLVLARKGIGPTNADRWWAVLALEVWRVGHVPGGPPVRLHLADACDLLVAAGYGGEAVA